MPEHPSPSDLCVVEHESEHVRNLQRGQAYLDGFVVQIAQGGLEEEEEGAVGEVGSTSMSSVGSGTGGLGGIGAMRLAGVGGSELGPA